jgi:hypothetical protein
MKMSCVSVKGFLARTPPEEPKHLTVVRWWAFEIIVGAGERWEEGGFQK